MIHVYKQVDRCFHYVVRLVVVSGFHAKIVVEQFDPETGRSTAMTLQRTRTKVHFGASIAPGGYATLIYIDDETKYSPRGFTLISRRFYASEDLFEHKDYRFVTGNCWSFAIKLYKKFTNLT